MCARCSQPQRRRPKRPELGDLREEPRRTDVGLRLHPDPRHSVPSSLRILHRPPRVLCQHRIGWNHPERSCVAACGSRAEPAEPRSRRGRIAEDVGRAAPILTARVRRLGEPPPARDRRVSPGGEPRAAGAARRPAPALHRRPTPPARAKGKALGRRVLNQLGGLVTPDTILRWYRELITNKYDGTARRRSARSGTAASLHGLVVQFATENPTWGYTLSL